LARKMEQTDGPMRLGAYEGSGWKAYLTGGKKRRGKLDLGKTETSKSRCCDGVFEESRSKKGVCLLRPPQKGRKRREKKTGNRLEEDQKN